MGFVLRWIWEALPIGYTVDRFLGPASAKRFLRTNTVPVTSSEL